MEELNVTLAIASIITLVFFLGYTVFHFEK